ncbi:MAG: hypothetical protein PHY47_16635 [Lachnospiraceae bacterium]|nr:hypothetical protein [Lachnospiraceae bacterium]
MSISKCFIEKVNISTRMVYKKDWCGDGEDKDTHSALVSMDITIRNLSPEPCTDFIRAVVVLQGEENAEKTICKREVVVANGETIFKLSMSIEDVRLWSTWDYGIPNLYNLTLEYAEDVYTSSFGFKELTYDKKHGTWKLNREKIFMRGYRLSAENSIDQVSDEKVSPQLLKDKGINTIYIVDEAADDDFLVECDKLGILVWKAYSVLKKDMPLDKISARADEVRELGSKVLNHACHGMWSIEAASDVYNEADESNQYLALCQVAYDSLKTLDPVKEVMLLNALENRALSLFSSDRMPQTDVHQIKNIHNITAMGLPKTASDAEEEEYVIKEAEYLRIRKYDPVSSVFVKDLIICDADSMMPVLVRFEPSLSPYCLGAKIEVPAGKTFTSRIWLINDYHEKIEDAQISWQAIDQNTSTVIAGNKFRLNILADSAEIPDHVVLPLSEEQKGHTIEIKTSVKTDETELSHKSLLLTVKNN